MPRPINSPINSLNTLNSAFKRPSFFRSVDENLKLAKSLFKGPSEFCHRISYDNLKMLSFNYVTSSEQRAAITEVINTTCDNITAYKIKNLLTAAVTSSDAKVKQYSFENAVKNWNSSLLNLRVGHLKNNRSIGKRFDPGVNEKEDGSISLSPQTKKVLPLLTKFIKQGLVQSIKFDNGLIFSSSLKDPIDSLKLSPRSKEMCKGLSGIPEVDLPQNSSDPSLKDSTESLELSPRNTEISKELDDDVSQIDSASNSSPSC